jgi:hypothetical protein
VLSAAACAAACGSTERLELELPSDRPLLLARTYQGHTERWALSPLRDPPDIPPINAWDGERLTLDVVELDALAPLAVGRLEPPAADVPSEPLGVQLGNRLGLAFTRTLEADADSRWTIAAAAPMSLAQLPLPRRSPCDRLEVKVVPTATTGLSYTTLAVLPAVRGVARAMVGAEWYSGGRAGALGVATATSVSLRPLPASDYAPRGLTWDGDVTVWGTILSLDAQLQRLVELDLSGHEQRSIALDRAPREELEFAITRDGRALAYSSTRVVELTRGATRALDRTAEYPPGLIALVEPRPDLRLAIAPMGTLLHHRDGAWRPDATETPLVKRLYVVGERVIALSETTLYERRGDGDWVAIADEYPTINKISVAGLPTGELIMSGGAGLISVYRGAPGWCALITGNTRYVYRLQMWSDYGVAFEYGGDDFELERSILYWIQPRR